MDIKWFFIIVELFLISDCVVLYVLVNKIVYCEVK